MTDGPSVPEVRQDASRPASSATASPAAPEGAARTIPPASVTHPAVHFVPVGVSWALAGVAVTAMLTGHDGGRVDFIIGAISLLTGAHSFFFSNKWRF